MEIDKIKKVMMGKASREEREEVESWAGGSAERKRFVEDARGFYAGEEIPDGEIEQRMRRIWQTMPVSIWRRRMIFRWAAAVACVLLAVGIGWSVWLPGTREGRMMPDGQEQGVQAVFHYIPLHTAPAGQRYGVFAGEDRYTTRESERLGRLPLYYNLSLEQADYVIDKVNAFYKER